MKKKGIKILGEERRKLILQWLRESEEAMTASTLAERTNVSRQVIVQDVSLLKARDEPIIATSRGYLYMNKDSRKTKPRRIIVVRHRPEETPDELNIIVDHGVCVRDVTVEHAVYGEITAPLMIRNRRDVKRFIDKITSSNASYLLELTQGIHLHTLEADTCAQLDEACEALEKANYMVSESV